MMWLLVANGLFYLGFVYLHGEWRDLVPRRGDVRDAWQMVRFYAFRRRDHPAQRKHNSLQKLAYFSLPYIGAMAVVTGVAVWKPVSLGWLTAAFGGFVWARYWHFVAMVLLVVVSAVHVFMIFAVDPYSLRSMISGCYDDDRSLERRNARPLHHLGRRWRSSNLPPTADSPDQFVATGSTAQPARANEEAPCACPGTQWLASTVALEADNGLSRSRLRRGCGGGATRATLTDWPGCAQFETRCLPQPR